MKDSKGYIWVVEMDFGKGYVPIHFEDTRKGARVEAAWSRMPSTRVRVRKYQRVGK